MMNPENLVDLLIILPLSVVAFIFLLTIIVFFHEYGHFSAARMLGVKVDVFSIGFGKPLARWVDRTGPEWRIASLPFGGYVKFFGDASGASDPDKSVTEAQKPAPATTQFPRSDSEASGMSEADKKVCFHFKPVWARAIIVAAGPMANFILAIVIFWGLLMTFGGLIVEPRVGSVIEGSAAEEAGFEDGDLIVTLNGRSLTRWDDLRTATMLSAGDPLKFEVERNGEIVALTAVPKRVEIDDGFGNKAYSGQLGIVAARDAQRWVTYGPLQALQEAVRKVANVLTATVKFLGRLILGKEDTRQLGGPVKMAQYAGQTAMSGFQDGGADGPSLGDRLKISLGNFINLAAIISVSIGFLNLLPIPVLDGGHLMYYGYEAMAGKPLGARAQAIGFRVGIVLLASFMLFVTWNDITNLLSLKS